MFIFPQNYNFKNKFLGFIEYSTIFFNLIWDLSIYFLSSILFHNFNFKMCFCIVFCFPIFLFSLIGFHHENILYVFHYLIKFFINRTVYLYRKY